MFNNLAMLQNSISSISEAMTIVSSNAQLFQTDGAKQTTYSFGPIFSEASASLSKSVSIVMTGYDMSQGGLKPGKPLNAAINGQGFFVLQPDNSNQQALTRASEFFFNSNGTLVDIYNRKVKGYRMVNGKPDKSELVDITLDPEKTNLADVGFEDNGVLTSNYQARKAATENNRLSDTMPEGEPLFQLAVAYVPNPSRMNQIQGNAFYTTNVSGPISYYGTSNEKNLGSVFGGSSESSNVNPAETTIIGLQHQRAYQLMQATVSMSTKFVSQLLELTSKA